MTQVDIEVRSRRLWFMVQTAYLEFDFENDMIVYTAKVDRKDIVFNNRRLI